MAQFHCIKLRLRRPQAYAKRETRAYLQEVHTCACYAPRESLELYAAVVSVGRKLVCHRVVARPLSTTDTTQRRSALPSFLWSDYIGYERRTLTLRMMRPRASALR